MRIDAVNEHFNQSANKILGGDHHLSTLDKLREAKWIFMGQDVKFTLTIDSYSL